MFAAKIDLRNHQDAENKTLAYSYDIVEYTNVFCNTDPSEQPYELDNSYIQTCYLKGYQYYGPKPLTSVMISVLYNDDNCVLFLSDKNRDRQNFNRR